ncbi:hypothetical protein SPHINGO8BC_51767 [Sphingobacterium multivorum]|uniref:Uncharacterized protein n=1 Tax=Sphingobacterium multivorum TaxID=28454 RepID=A0A654D910_SPHMU|nr:hypothetical protein SPHINGO8BC_51767 [Sphingobacterium multivorum]
MSFKGYAGLAVMLCEKSALNSVLELRRSEGAWSKFIKGK